jgi:hypothetical protein
MDNATVYERALAHYVSNVEADHLAGALPSLEHMARVVQIVAESRVKRNNALVYTDEMVSELAYDVWRDFNED